jgi:two-component system chemotaxis response regulator CheV
MVKSVGALPEVLKVGSNEMELVVFKMSCILSDKTLEVRNYGVNVAKVREIIPMPSLTTVPDMPDFANALAEVRGVVIPIIDLGKWMKLDVPQETEIRPKVIVVEMLKTTVGIIVHDVERIRRIKWTQIKPPPALLQSKHGGKITGVTKLDEDENLLLILDLESVIQDIGAIIPDKNMSLDTFSAPERKKFKGNVLIVDDSTVARRILRDILIGMGLSVIEAIDGKQALEVLKEFKQKIGDKPISEYINLIVTDVEMPQMDGLTFTRLVKSDPAFSMLPVIVNTSLSGDENRTKAKVVGADGYLVKFDTNQIAAEVGKLLK